MDDLVQDCSNSSVLAMELLQSCIEPSIYEHIRERVITDLGNGLAPDRRQAIV